MPKISAARYAAVTSTLALAVALGGTSYAAVKVGTANLKNNAVVSSKIKNGTVTGADVKDGSITGKDVDEGSLARVPNADSALRAQTAGALDGQTIQSVHTSEPTTSGRPHFVYLGEHLRIEMRCAVGAYELVATTDTVGATISTFAIGDTSPPTVREADLENGGFSEATGEFDLFAGGPGDLAQVTFTYGDDDSLVQGTLVADIDGSQAEPCRLDGFITASR